MVKRDPTVILLFSFTLWFFATLPYSVTSQEVRRSLTSRGIFGNGTFEEGARRKMKEEDKISLAEFLSKEAQHGFGEVSFEEKDGEYPCRRTCKAGETKTCKYEFEIEHYSTLSKACFDCPYNASHCSSKHCIPGDGVQRTVLVINRQMPGPAIEVCRGDAIEVEVKNQMLDVSTTIHWHGLLQKETPFMDGVPFVSQCLIPPQADFLYSFYADNPGTHLWHSHSALQRGDGIFGPLIVKVPPSEDPHADLYDFDLSEHVVTILDWEHVLSSNKFVAHYHSGGDNKPPSILVNGKGRFKEFTVGDQVIFTPVEKFTVKSGFRYRFRIISAGFLNCPIQISVDNHAMKVIASDGGNLEPVEAESLVVTAGERFDIILTADQPVGNYWMRFKGLLDCKIKNAFQVAILHYEGADENADPEPYPIYDAPNATDLMVNAVNTGVGTDGSLVMSELSSAGSDGADDPVLKPEPDLKFYLPYDFYPVDNIHYHYAPYYGFYNSEELTRTYTPQINHIAMRFPTFPLMADLERSATLDLCNASSVAMECLYKFCECPHVIQVPLNAVVELILIDEGKPYDANHPFHLHGYNFRVLGTDRLGDSTTEGEVRNLDRQGLLKRNLVKPPIKDTVSVPDGGYTVIRFHATNPGFWILHCHLDFHVELGMALLFKVGDFSTYKSPPPNFPMCGENFRPKPVKQDIFAKFFPTEWKIRKELRLVNLRPPRQEFPICKLPTSDISKKYIHFYCGTFHLQATESLDRHIFQNTASQSENRQRKHFLKLWNKSQVIDRIMEKKIKNGKGTSDSKPPEL